MNAEPQISDKRGALTRLRADLPLVILCSLMFLLPLYRTSLLEDSFITPKVFLLQLCGVFALLGLLVRRSEDARPTTACREYAGWLFCALVAVHAITLVYARSAALGLHAVVYWLTMLILYFIVRWTARDTRGLNLLFASGASAAVLTAIWTIYEDATHGQGFGAIIARLPDWRGHLAAGLGNSGHIAGLMGLFLPWMLYRLLAAERTPWVLLLGLIPVAMAFVITWSVGSSGATLLSLLIWSIIAWRSGALANARLSRAAWLLLPLAIALAVYMLPHPLNPHAPSLVKEAFGSKRWEEGWPTRIVIWKTTEHMIAAHPLLGIGAGNFTLEYVRQVVPSVIADPALRVYAGAFTNDAHNEYLQIWCETGLAGLVIYLAMITAFFVQLIRTLRVTTSTEERWLLLCAGAGVTVFLLDSLMTFPIRLPAHFSIFAMFLAVPAVLQHANAPAETPLQPAVASRLAPALALLMLIGCFYVHGRRVMAEYHLKTGRTAVETEPVMIGGRPVPTWALAESFYRQALENLARGDRTAMQASLSQARLALQTPAADVAEQQFRKALAWDTRYSNASSRLGALVLMRGDAKQASEVTQQTLHDLESSEIWERLGFAEFLLSHYKQAYAAWTLCKDRRPVQADIYTALLRQIPPQ